MDFYKEKALQTEEPFFCSIAPKNCWTQLASATGRDAYCQNITEGNYYPTTDSTEAQKTEERRACLSATGDNPTDMFGNTNFETLLQEFITSYSQDIKFVSTEQVADRQVNDLDVHIYSAEAEQQTDPALPPVSYEITVNEFRYPSMAQLSFDQLHTNKGESGLSLTVTDPMVIEKYSKSENAYLYQLLGHRTNPGYSNNFQSIYSLLIADNIHAVIEMNYNFITNETKMNERLYELGKAFDEFMQDQVER